MAGMANPTQTVSTAKAETTDWQSRLEGVGTLRAVSGSDLSIELAGIVDKINFKSGDDVKAGQLLLQLRVEDDVAKLESLQAVADLAKITLDRDTKQLSVKAIAQAIVDNDTAAYKNDLAQVAQQQALLDKKSLKAPFDGHLGIRQVDIGQYLQRRHADRDPAGARPDLSRLLPAAAGAEPDQGRPAGDGQDRRLSRPKLPRRDHGHQSQGRGNQPQPADPRDAQERRPQAAARHVRHRPDRHRRAAEAGDAAANGDHLQCLWQHGLSRRGQGQGRQGRAEAAGAARLRHDRRHARRPGRRPEGRERGRDRHHRRPDEAARRLAGAR